MLQPGDEGMSSTFSAIAAPSYWGPMWHQAQELRTDRLFPMLSTFPLLALKYCGGRNSLMECRGEVKGIHGDEEMVAGGGKVWERGRDRNQFSRAEFSSLNPVTILSPPAILSLIHCAPSNFCNKGGNRQ